MRHPQPHRHVDQEIPQQRRRDEQYRFALLARHLPPARRPRLLDARRRVRADALAAGLLDIVRKRQHPTIDPQRVLELRIDAPRHGHDPDRSEDDEITRNPNPLFPACLPIDCRSDRLVNPPSGANARTPPPLGMAGFRWGGSVSSPLGHATELGFWRWLAMIRWSHACWASSNVVRQ